MEENDNTWRISSTQVQHIKKITRFTAFMDACKYRLHFRTSSKDARLVAEEHRLRIKNNLTFPPVSLATDL